MGGLLSQPETTKDSTHGEGLGLRYGYSSMQGWRLEMEDAHDIKVGLKDKGLNDWSFFAVFDGHAGKCSAAYAATRLLDYILKDTTTEQDSLTTSKTDELDDEPTAATAEQTTPPTSPCPLYDSSWDQGFDNQEIKGLDQLSDSETCKLSTDSPNQKQANNGDGDDAVKSNDAKEKEKDEEEEKKEEDEQKSDQCQEVPKPKFVSAPIVEQLDMVKNAIRDGFLKIDDSMRYASKDQSGSTAVCALLSPTHFFIANCGDSRAVLYDGKKPKFVTEDHKPFNPKERKRIIEAGGTATVRINGCLAVSRALGDFEYKKDDQRGPCEQLVSPEPEVTIIERHHEDEFLILACDGIWDVMNAEDICQYVRYKLTTESNLENVCSSVLDVCLRKGSRDNMSIIIVVFETGPKVLASEIERDKKNDEILLNHANWFQEKNTDIGFTDFFIQLRSELDQQLNEITPPGAGIEAKYDLLRENFDNNAAKYPNEKTE